MNKLVVICAGDMLTTRTERLLAEIQSRYPAMIVDRIDIRDKPFDGINWTDVYFDEYKVHHETHTPWQVPLNRKPKPYYRKGERW